MQSCPEVIIFLSFYAISVTFSDVEIKELKICADATLKLRVKQMSWGIFVIEVNLRQFASLRNLSPLTRSISQLLGQNILEICGIQCFWNWRIFASRCITVLYRNLSPMKYLTLIRSKYPLIMLNTRFIKLTHFCVNLRHIVNCQHFHKIPISLI